MNIMEMLTDWPLGTIIGTLFIILVLILVGLIVRGLFIAIDSWFLPRRHGMGMVVGKTFIPAHTQMILIYNAGTQTSLPQPIFQPDDWSVRVEINGRQDSMSVSRGLFDSLSERGSVVVEYVSGRFSDNIYLKEISRA